MDVSSPPPVDTFSLTFGFGVRNSEFGVSVSNFDEKSFSVGDFLTPFLVRFRMVRMLEVVAGVPTGDAVVLDDPLPKGRPCKTMI
jgi:hypothetical protein